MRPIRIDFGAGLVRRRTYVQRGLLVAGVLAMLLASWMAWQLGTELERWQSDLSLIEQASRKPRSGAASEENSLKEEMQVANHIIEKLTTPWADLFAAIEAAYSEQTILLGAEPDPENREINLTAEAKDLNAMLEFVKQVRATGVMADAYVASHQVNQQDSQRPVRFVVQAHWRNKVHVPAPAPQAESVPAPASSSDAGQAEAAKPAADAGEKGQ